MKNIPKTIMTIQTIIFPLWSFKHKKSSFKKLSAHLGGSFSYVFTLTQMLLDSQTHDGFTWTQLCQKSYFLQQQNS